MTGRQEAQLLTIKMDFAAEVDRKYRAGAAEHGGDLADKTAGELVDDAMDEVVDLYTYLHGVREKLRRIERACNMRAPEDIRPLCEVPAANR